ncbi:polysaccharide biosynthesis/export family protein [Jejuia pallidilutea]|jgi:polysaccharide export outer membrane protein|uniref:Polysaccharide export outer membrane protein n=1 Tax=Jejuia pallidilutea TaxID=504487 RepID=A0A090WHV7_9FLAO|nr:polysaccharide biosynthesis/export family protein [Jejuia pallidilutea]GAL67072.1 polysaccharide export outer membrane protein [Jejuia pallidilutea]GAL70782.1 polysaccharide export outer membrane protein [Jejuia pallidilutea]GAL90642.1 polysaccharide export outer membrane protein [Jejuia pallidilutea]
MSSFYSKKQTFFSAVILVITLLQFSCGSSEKIVYFQNAKDFETIVDTDTFTPKFKVNDIVSIHVSTFDLEAVKPFNLTRGTEASANSVPIDYLVDNDGNIDYPVLGKIKLLGLTVEESKELLKEKLSEYLKDPIINIRILNFRVSILGEVRSPGRYSISGERITLLEAIALAGDLTIKGKRDNVTVIRDFQGTKTYTKVDLTSKELFNSPVYYLTQNDIVYVEPNKSAISSGFIDSRTSIAISIASILITSTIILVTQLNR